MSIPVISSIINWFRGAKAKASQAFILLFGADAAAKFAAATLALLKTAEGVIIADAVNFIEAVNPGGTSEEKYQAAFDKVVADFKAIGKALPVSIINMLIEMAVQAIVKRNVIIG